MFENMWRCFLIFRNRYRIVSEFDGPEALVDIIATTANFFEILIYLLEKIIGVIDFKLKFLTYRFQYGDRAHVFYKNGQEVTSNVIFWSSNVLSIISTFLSCHQYAFRLYQSNKVFRSRPWAVKLYKILCVNGFVNLKKWEYAVYSSTHCRTRSNDS